MKTLWRPFNPWVSGKTGEPLNSPRWSHREWGKFEVILEKAFHTLGIEPVIQPENIRKGDRLDEALLGVYAHRTMRDVMGKTAYSYPFFARTKRRLFYMLMHVPGWFHLDTEGWGVDNSATKKPFFKDRILPGEASRFVEELKCKLVNNNVSKHTQPPPSKSPSSGYVLHCIQMPQDYTIVHHSSVGVGEMVAKLAWWATARKIPLVLKPHPVATPAEISMILERVKGGKFISVCQGNIHSLIAAAKVVMVINSGTGVEALIHGKPVVTFGRCDYERATFRGIPEDLDACYDWVASHTPDLQERFLLWYYRTHIFDIQDPSCDNRVVNVVKNTIED